ncbi:MAG TPA: phage/plasmid primase, P4 family [Nitrososphaera sp.]|nr:phage/plasmid primase, P4 family [Nitrososphaera sp.]
MIAFGLQDEAEIAIMQVLRDRKSSETDKKGALVEEILNRIFIRTLQDTGEILYYRDGVYVPGGREKILAELQNLGGYEITNHMRNEVIETIKSMTYTPREEFDKDPNILNLKNGLLNIQTGEFRKEHDPNYLSVTQIPIIYNEKAKCPNIIKFLRSTIEPEYMATVSKMLGYLLLKSARYQKGFMLCGEGSNGKSVFLGLIEAFLGAENVSNVSLHDLTSDRYASAELYGKMANIFADLRADKITDAGTFKVVVSGDRIRAQRKHQQPFTFKPYAKLIFSANQIPETSDKSYAYFRRWVIIPFFRTFEGKNRDETLKEKLTTEEELSGLLNLALKGLKKLRDEHGFKDDDVEEIKRQYELGASRIKTFIEEECILQPENENLWIESDKLREAFKAYCEKEGTSFINERKLGEELKALGISHKQKRIGRDKRYCYFGIALKKDCLAVLDKTPTYLAIQEDHNTIERKIEGNSIETIRQFASNSEALFFSHTAHVS